jgi:membrane associated rhomboid family serine protease
MFIPIGDENPTERTPYVNYVLIATNVLAFFAFCLGPADDPSLIRWTMIPADLHWPTLFTSLFLHGGWMHLIGNMVFLWIFGDNVEDRLGHLGYVVFYFVCGLAADAAHILSNPASQLPTLGASGAISGVMGAYILFFPRQSVKTFVWLGIWYADVIRTPAWLWIGFWFVQQVLLNMLSRGGGGVAYLAHIGGFVAGLAIAGAIRLVVGRGSSAPRREDHGVPDNARRFFTPVPEDPGIDFIDEPGDRYSLVYLGEDPVDFQAIGEAVSAVTGISREEAARHARTTHGMIAREVSRENALAIQKDLQARGIPSALILHNRSNQPPPPALVDGASWDNRFLRLRVADQILLLPWTNPFLWVAARSEGRTFIDFLVTRRSAFRVVDSRAVPLTEVDPSGRNEVTAGFTGFARAILRNAPAETITPGIRIAAVQDAWGRLDFPRNSDYDDYVFRVYNLILARSARA